MLLSALEVTSALLVVTVVERLGELSVSASVVTVGAEPLDSDNGGVVEAETFADWIRRAKHAFQ